MEKDEIQIQGVSLQITNQNSFSQQQKSVLQIHDPNAMLDRDLIDNVSSEIINATSYEDETHLENLDSNKSCEIKTIQSLQNSLETNSNPETIFMNKDFPTKVNEEELQAKQLLSAKRSLETNLYLILAFIVVLGSTIILPRKEFFTVIAFSIMKGAMPILTIIVNFGTIRSVMTQYKDGLKQTFSNISQIIILRLIC